MKALIIFLILSAPAGAAELRLSLKDAEAGAVAASGRYRAARLEARSAKAAEAAASSLLYPKLNLEGSLRYASEVPMINMPAALGGARPLGDNWNYSFGPAAYWTLDTGALRYGRDAARSLAAAGSEEEEAARRQAVLDSRASYFRVQLALEKVYLIGETLQLSLRQMRDMELGVKAGTRSRLDGIRARQEVTARNRELLRARTALSSALKDFAFLTGLEIPEAPGLPLDARMKSFDGQVAPGVRVSAESYGEILERLMPAARRTFSGVQPSLEALSRRENAYRASAGALRSGRLPRVLISARSSVDYPNGPNLYSFLQNSAGLSLSLPLFEKGRLAEQEREALLKAEAVAERRREASRGLARDFSAALEEYGSLMEEQELNISAVDDAAEAARLAYEAYKAGAATWLEVESANLKELQAKTTAASVNAEILLKLAVLDSLSGSVN